MEHSENLTPIPFASMQYLYVTETILTWEYAGEYSFVRENDKMGLAEKREGFYSEKGFITISSIDNILLTNDSNNNYYTVHVFFNGQSIPFSTKKESEAENLYDALFFSKFGFSIGLVVTYAPPTLD